MLVYTFAKIVIPYKLKLFLPYFLNKKQCLHVFLLGRWFVISAGCYVGVAKCNSGEWDGENTTQRMGKILALNVGR